MKYQKALVRAICAGKIFIYPTDTIYGLGCDATNRKSVEKIRKLKHRERQPFLVAVPNLEWIWQNCEVTDLEKHQIEQKLPGRYAFFLKIKNKKALVYKEINPSDDGTIGIRFFNHAFQNIITKAGVPFVSTSVNISNEPFSETIEHMPGSIKRASDYVIYQGPISGPPSTKIDLTKT